MAAGAGTAQAVRGILASHPVLLKSPGALKLNEFYPSPASSESSIAPASVNRGQNRVSANSKTAPGRSDFNISSSSICGVPYIYVQYPTAWAAWYNTTMYNTTGTPVHHDVKNFITPTNDGWLFDAIASIQVTFFNSMIQALTFDGPTIKAMVLAYCESDDMRNQVILNAGQCECSGLINGSPYIGKAMIPFPFLSFGLTNQQSFSFDNSVLSGGYQISVNWKHPNEWITRMYYTLSSTNFTVGPGIGVTGTTRLDPLYQPFIWDQCYITMKQTLPLYEAFAVKSFMAADPNATLSYPAHYITRVTDIRDNTAKDTEITFNLNSAPNGMLEGIFVQLFPIYPSETSDLMGGSNVRSFGGLTLTEIVLSYQGQDLFRTESANEYDTFMTSEMTNSLSYIQNSRFLEDVTNVYWDGWNSMNTIKGQVYFIPLNFNPRDVLYGALEENNPGFGGSQLQLKIKYNNPITIKRFDPPFFPFREYVPDTVPNTEGTPVPANMSSVQLNVHWLIRSLVEINNGVVQLQM